MSEARPLYLLCNDDGVHAPGIKALMEAVAAFGDVVVVAPHVERSGSSQALSLHMPLRMEQLGENIYAIEGTPTDCVLFALRRILPRRPDWVISGINRGSNIGQDTLYSGTVAAAMEGSVNEIPAIAVSLKGRSHHEPEHYDVPSRIVRMLLENPALVEPAKKAVLNVNVPDVSMDEIQGFAITTLGRRAYDPNIYENTDPRGRPYYWLGGGEEEFEDIEGSDCKLLHENYVTLTVLQPDFCHREANDELRAAFAGWKEMPFRSPR